MTILAGYVVRLSRRSGIAWPGRYQASPSAATCGHAQDADPPQKPVGRPQIDLTFRAMSLHNRDRSAARRYLALHQTLAKGR